ncbi:unnamed protein product [Didymodactylos carnosus]|uniref:Uncharacterized protein n=1 Tax=Didymodactylos carnosus TaxID=1234261 RepID=A0A815ER61_9BILA|nr:unnamed protein product [Didymodactylos carnosus]CAF4146058.1 unnamed protein product [Didymodactylos carnosus]
MPKPKPTTQTKLKELVNSTTQINEFGKRILQNKPKMYMDQLYEGAQICCQHAGRKRIKLCDVTCALNVRGEGYGIDIDLPKPDFTLELLLEFDWETDFVDNDIDDDQTHHESRSNYQPVSTVDDIGSDHEGATGLGNGKNNVVLLPSPLVVRVSVNDLL